MGYPKWKYHRSEAARIVEDAAEEAALGEGWADTPAAFENDQAGDQPGAKSERKRGRR